MLRGYSRTTGTTNTNNNSQRDLFAVTLTTASVTNNNADFGYTRNTGGNIGDFIWHDRDKNGLQGNIATEPGVPNVRVNLQVTYANGTVVNIVTFTNASGIYSFGNLLLDEQLDGIGAGEPTFVLSVTPPTGASLTTSNVGADDTIDSDGNPQTVAPTKGTTNTTYDVGFTTPTAVTLVSFTATSLENGVQLRWETATEFESQGFHLLRSGEGRKENAVQITKSLIAARGTGVNGAVYTFTDTTAGDGIGYQYWLEEVDNNGKHTAYGPILVVQPQTKSKVWLPAIIRK